jgi:hypothetical protein
MSDRQVSSLGLVAVISMVGLGFGLVQPGNITPTILLASSGDAARAVSASAAGRPAAPEYLCKAKVAARVI